MGEPRAVKGRPEPQGRPLHGPQKLRPANLGRGEPAAWRSPHGRAAAGPNLSPRPALRPARRRAPRPVRSGRGRPRRAALRLVPARRRAAHAPSIEATGLMKREEEEAKASLASLASSAVKARSSTGSCRPSARRRSTSRVQPPRMRSESGGVVSTPLLETIQALLAAPSRTRPSSSTNHAASWPPVAGLLQSEAVGQKRDGLEIGPGPARIGQGAHPIAPGRDGRRRRTAHRRHPGCRSHGRVGKGVALGAAPRLI